MSKRRVNSEAPTPLKIAMTLIYAAEPMTLSELSKEVGLDRQLVRYHMPHLIKDGLVLEVEHNNNILYSPQAIFIDSEIMEDLKNTFTPIFKKIANNLIYPEPDEAEFILRNNVLLYMNMIENLL